MGASSNQHESKKQAQNFDAKNTIFSRRRFDVVFVLFFLVYLFMFGALWCFSLAVFKWY